MLSTTSTLPPIGLSEPRALVATNRPGAVPAVLGVAVAVQVVLQAMLAARG